jgi:hypothetical protein
LYGAGTGAEKKQRKRRRRLRYQRRRRSRWFLTALRWQGKAEVEAAAERNVPTPLTKPLCLVMHLAVIIDIY